MTRAIIQSLRIGTGAGDNPYRPSILDTAPPLYYVDVTPEEDSDVMLCDVSYRNPGDLAAADRDPNSQVLYIEAA